eukprot:TRINITY_DN14710_c0_g1_i1.p1 TRINITY_DN14710_c0_g1~~TRINITY_DN14710_c0_g1_i1.p1  ORF type:complete len:1377 (-),score=139.67 TRINITY_DN14710_c0_g1_i1:34-4164(-)
MLRVTVAQASGVAHDWPYLRLWLGSQQGVTTISPTLQWNEWFDFAFDNSSTELSVSVFGGPQRSVVTAAALAHATLPLRDLSQNTKVRAKMQCRPAQGSEVVLDLSISRVKERRAIRTIPPDEQVLDDARIVRFCVVDAIRLPVETALADIEIGKQRRTAAIRSDASHDIENFDFLIPQRDLEKAAINVSVRQPGNQRPLGAATTTLGDLWLAEDRKADTWIAVGSCKLRVRTELVRDPALPNGDLPCVAGITPVAVKVAEAVVDAELASTLLYVEAGLAGNEMRTAQAAEASKGWHESFYLHVPANEPVHFSLLPEKGNEIIGRCVLPFSDLVRTSGSERWLPITRLVGPTTRAIGALHIFVSPTARNSVTVDDFEISVLQVESAGASYDLHLSASTTSYHTVKAPLREVTPRRFRFTTPASSRLKLKLQPLGGGPSFEAKPLLSELSEEPMWLSLRSSGDGSRSVRLLIKKATMSAGPSAHSFVVQVRRAAGAERLPLPFVQLRWAGTSVQTSQKSGAVWEECFTFEPVPEQRSLRVSLYPGDGSPQPEGEAIVAFNDALQSGERWVPMQSLAAGSPRESGLALLIDIRPAGGRQASPPRTPSPRQHSPQRAQSGRAELHPPVGKTIITVVEATNLSIASGSSLAVELSIGTEKFRSRQAVRGGTAVVWNENFHLQRAPTQKQGPISIALLSGGVPICQGSLTAGEILREGDHRVQLAEAVRSEPVGTLHIRVRQHNSQNNSVEAALVAEPPVDIHATVCQARNLRRLKAGWPDPVCIELTLSGVKRRTSVRCEENPQWWESLSLPATESSQVLQVVVWANQGEEEFVIGKAKVALDQLATAQSPRWIPLTAADDLAAGSVQLIIAPFESPSSTAPAPSRAQATGDILVTLVEARDLPCSVGGNPPSAFAVLQTLHDDPIRLCATRVLPRTKDPHWRETFRLNRLSLADPPRVVPTVAVVVRDAASGETPLGTAALSLPENIAHRREVVLELHNHHGKTGATVKIFLESSSDSGRNASLRQAGNVPPGQSAHSTGSLQVTVLEAEIADPVAAPRVALCLEHSRLISAAQQGPTTQPIWRQQIAMPLPQKRPWRLTVELLDGENVVASGVVKDLTPSDPPATIWVPVASQRGEPVGVVQLEVGAVNTETEASILALAATVEEADELRQWEELMRRVREQDTVHVRRMQEHLYRVVDHQTTPRPSSPASPTTPASPRSEAHQLTRITESNSLGFDTDSDEGEYGTANISDLKLEALRVERPVQYALEVVEQLPATVRPPSRLPLAGDTPPPPTPPPLPIMTGMTPIAATKRPISRLPSPPPRPLSPIRTAGSLPPRPAPRAPMTAAAAALASPLRMPSPRRRDEVFFRHIQSRLVP